MQASNTSFITPFLYTLAFNVPYLVVYILGMVLSIVFRERNVKVSALSFIAFLLFTLVTVITIGHYAWLYFYMYPSGNYSAGVISISFTVISTIRTLFELIGFVLLIIAIFMKRNVLTQQPPLPNQF